MSSDHGADEHWERVASELQAQRQAQQQAWGDVDNATLGRYLADDVTPEERRRIETALNERPELRKLTDLVSDVLRDCEPASTTETTARPAVLPFRKAPPIPKANHRWRRYAAVAVAACLLFGLGYVVLPKTGSAPHAGNAPLLSGAFTAAHRNGEVPGPSKPAHTDHTPEGATTPSVETAIPDPVVLACADGLNWAGEHLQSAGDLDKAEWSYNLAHKIQVWKLGPDAPTTVETVHKLGDVYQVALNTSDADAYAPKMMVKTAPANPPATEIPHPSFVMEKRHDQLLNSANQLRERITRQPPAEVRKSVVPILVQNLRDARTPQAREQLGLALAELGPAANDAVPVLEECLQKAQSPEERAVVLRALGEMGPAAGANAAPVLVTSLKSPSPVVRRAAEEALVQYGAAGRDALNRMKDADGTPAERGEWENLKNRILQAEGRVGVHDAAELFSPLALKEARHMTRELVHHSNVMVLAETEAVSADRPEDKVAVNGVRFVIQPSPVRVDVYVGQGLRDQGFGEKQQDQLRRLVETEAARKDYDRALLEGVRFIARFQAKKATP